jgi:hypothetical protein
MNPGAIYQLLSELQDTCISTHDIFRNQIFSDIDYSSVISFVPLWITETGNSAEDSLSKTTFEKLVQKNNNILTHKYLYYYDCDMLVSALQDRFSIIWSLLEKFHRRMPSESKYKITDFDHITISNDTELFAYLNSLFIYLASSFDIITKIAYELQNVQSRDYSVYPQMKSKSILFGDKRKIKNIQTKNTLFDYPTIVRKIESIRNRIVHDGSFDYSQNLYTGWIEKDDFFECFILFPDFDLSGNFLSYKNRCNFHNGSTRINLVLPSILSEILGLIKTTLLEINNTYNIKRYSNVSDIIKFKTEIQQWTESYVSILTKSLSEQD